MTLKSMSKKKNSLTEYVSFGNTKLDKDTLIFNMETATYCSAGLEGLCQFFNKKGKQGCYAKKAEYLYPQSLPYRLRQQDLYKDNDAFTLAEYFISLIKRKRNPIKYIRFNESGDFETMESVEKCLQISELFYSMYGKKIKLYTYTHRTDFFKNFDKPIPPNLTINISCDTQEIYDEFEGKGFNRILFKKEFEKSDKYKCLADCRLCNLCKLTYKKPITITFKFH